MILLPKKKKNVYPKEDVHTLDWPDIFSVADSSFLC